MQSGTDEASFNTSIGIACGCHGSEIEGTDSQRTRNEDKYLQFLVRLNYSIAVDTQFPSKTTSVCGQSSGREQIQLMFHSGNM